MLLRQVALVLRLQVDAPARRGIQTSCLTPADFHRLGVGDAQERALDHELEALVQPLLHELSKKVEVLGAMFQRVTGDGLDELLGHVHVAQQVAEGHFRLDHPELGGVARGVGILGPEGGAEGVNVGERAGEGLPFKLAADGQVGGLAEEILLRLLVRFALERGDAEHFPRPLAIAGRDDRRVQIDEVAALKKFVDGEGQLAADAEDGAEKIGARTQVADAAEKFQRVAFFLQRIGGVRRADKFDFGRAQPPFLAVAGEATSSPSTTADAPVVKWAMCS